MNFRLQLPPGLTACAHAAMATEFVFHLGGHEPAYLHQAATEAFLRLDQLESSLSFYRESSDVTRLNRAAAGTEVAVGPDTLDGASPFGFQVSPSPRRPPTSPVAPSMHSPDAPGSAPKTRRHRPI